MIRNELDEILNFYNGALSLLDDYDHERLTRPAGTATEYRPTYEEYLSLIGAMRFFEDSDLFGREKDDSFRGSIGNIYQTYGGSELYPSFEEKAATLLYLVTKNHSFLDGNKRIAATVFLYFLKKNGRLLDDNNRARLAPSALAALTLMIAASRPEDKDAMISIVSSLLTNKY